MQKLLEGVRAFLNMAPCPLSQVKALITRDLCREPSFITDQAFPQTKFSAGGRGRQQYNCRAQRPKSLELPWPWPMVWLVCPVLAVDVIASSSH